MKIYKERNFFKEGNRSGLVVGPQRESVYRPRGLGTTPHANFQPYALF